MLDEDRFAALALARTLAFCTYSVLAFLAAVILTLAMPQEWVAPLSRGSMILFLFVVFDLPLLVISFKGDLPATATGAGTPVSESTLGFVFSAASILTWVFAGSGEAGRLIQLVFSWSLLFFVLVYFLAKSTVSGQPRIRVLLVAILPALQIADLLP